MMTKAERELVYKLYEIAQKQENDSKIKVVDINLKQSIQIGDYSWSLFFKDKEGNGYFLLDEEHVINKKFGENNNYLASDIRKLANDCEPSVQALSNFKEDAFIQIIIDLFSHDGLHDYGVCKGDIFGIMTYDMYRNNRENINIDCSNMWLSTPSSTPSGVGSSRAQYIYSDGDVSCDGCGWNGCGVRPFFILKSDIFVSLVE